MKQPELKSGIGNPETDKSTGPIAMALQPGRVKRLIDAHFEKRRTWIPEDKTQKTNGPVVMVLRAAAVQ